MGGISMIVYIIHRDIPCEWGEVYGVTGSFDDAIVKACNMIMISSVSGGASRIEESELSIEAWQTNSSCGIRNGFIASLCLTDIRDEEQLDKFRCKVEESENDEPTDMGS
jgi:hypothetical protein